MFASNTPHAAGQSLAALMLRSTNWSLPHSDGDGRDGDAAPAREVGEDEANAGMAARARVSLDRVERHRLPAALLAALLAGCDPKTLNPKSWPGSSATECRHSTSTSFRAHCICRRRCWQRCSPGVAAP
jgi:hypothetical protein